MEKIVLSPRTDPANSAKSGDNRFIPVVSRKTEKISLVCPVYAVMLTESFPDTA